MRCAVIAFPLEIHTIKIFGCAMKLNFVMPTELMHRIRKFFVCGMCRSVTLAIERYWICLSALCTNDWLHSCTIHNVQSIYHGLWIFLSTMENSSTKKMHRTFEWNFFIWNVSSTIYSIFLWFFQCSMVWENVFEKRENVEFSEAIFIRSA